MDAQRYLDPRLLELDPSPVPLPDSLREARASMAAVSADVLAIDDDQLTRPWTWTGEGQVDVRSGIYMAAMELADLAGRVERALAAAHLERGPAAAPIAAATRARWDLHGVLATLAEADLDADPGDEEWDIRHVLGHIIEVQRVYPWFSAWWLSQAYGSGVAPEADEAHAEGLPTEEAERSGTLADLRSRLDALVDLSGALWTVAGDEEMAAPAGWAGYPLTVGFRTSRWSSHLVEHTIQVDKTLVMLDRLTPEVERLHRLLLRSYGDLEGTIAGQPTSALEAPCGDSDVAGALADGVGQVAGLVADAAAAARR